MSVHVAFMKVPVRDKVLAGVKTCESRMSMRAHPCRRTEPGDYLLFKVVSGDGFAIARVSAVERFDSLTPERFDALQAQYIEAVSGPPTSWDADYWGAKRDCPHAVFIHFETFVPVSVPASALPRGVMLGWVQDWTPGAETRELLSATLGPCRCSGS